jgi:hypothetical protein
MLIRICFSNSNINILTWDKFLKQSRGKINSTPFKEILSNNMGEIIIEYDVIKLDKREISDLINDNFLSEYFQQSEFTIEEINSDQAFNDMSFDKIKMFDIIKTYKIESKELKVECINEDRAYLNNLHLCYLLTNKNLLPWYYQHYIQTITWLPEGGSNYTEYGYEFLSELIEPTLLDYEFMNKETNILEFVINKINSGFYIIINLDEFYLPQKSSYGTRHFVHPALVYGYDNVNFKMKAIGFDSLSAINKIEFGYDAFFKAFEKGKLYNMNGAEGKPAVFLIKLKEYEHEYPFDIKKFLRELHDYIFSEFDPAKEYFYKEVYKKTAVRFGFDAYDVLINSLKVTYENTELIEYSSFHFIWEHKKGIYKRLEYVALKYNIAGRFIELLNEYESIVKLADKARHVLLKNIMSKSDKGKLHLKIQLDEILYKKLTDILKIMRDMESRILLNVYRYLKFNLFSNTEQHSKINISLNATRTIMNLESKNNEIYTQVFSCIELKWDSPKTIGKIRLLDKQCISNWRIIGRLHFSDDTYIHISDSYSFYGTMKEIDFMPKTVSWVRFEEINNSSIDLDLIDIEVFETGNVVV